MKTKPNFLNPKRMFFIMVGGVCLTAAIGIVGLVIGNNFLQKESNKLVNLKLQDQIPEAQQTALKAAKADITKYQQLANTAKTVVPQDKDQARTVREIVGFANQSYDPVAKRSIQLLSITFPGSNLGQTTVTPTSGSATTTTTTPSVTTPSISQVQPVTGITGVYLLPITVASDPNVPVTFDQIVSFLSALEQNRRTAQVSQISITPLPNTGGKGLSFTIIINVYIKP